MVEKVFIVASLLSAAAQAKKVYEILPFSIRGKTYLLLALAFALQGLYPIYKSEIILILSRAFITAGVIQYITPFVGGAFRSLRPSGWIGWFLSTVTVLTVSLVLLKFADELSAPHIVIVVLDIIAVSAGFWTTVAFWGSEIGKRWIGGAAALVLLVTGDVTLFINRTAGEILLSVMVLLMALVALKRG